MHPSVAGTFLAGQATEYARMIGRNVTISRNLFGTSFFTLTGFHGLHVLVGLILLAVMGGIYATRSRAGIAGPAVNAISLYWHFVDVVWVAVFSVVYVWGLLR